jgi:hypothetical protein
MADGQNPSNRAIPLKRQSPWKGQKMKALGVLAAIAIGGSASAQELWHIGKPADFYGIYFMVPINLINQGGRGIEQVDGGRRVTFNAPNMNVKAKQEKMVGRVEVKMTDVVYRDLACHYYSSVYVVDAQPGTTIKDVQRKIETWVDFKGVTKRVRTAYADKYKRVDIDAIFEKDSIEMDIVENGKARHLSLNPSQGVEAFNNPVAEMLKNADKDRPEKVWCTIDPTNGGIIQYKIRLKGKFVPPVGSRSTIKGYSFEVKGPVGIHTMYVSDDGQLRQIDFADTSVVRANFVAPIGG